MLIAKIANIANIETGEIRPTVRPPCKEPDSILAILAILAMLAMLAIC